MIRLLVLWVLLLWPAAAHADVMDYSQFARLPVQVNGRVMPLERAAVLHYGFFMDERDPDSYAALDWFAQTLFAPMGALEQPIFTVDATLRQTLGIPPTDVTLFSYADLMPLLAKQEKSVTTLMERDRADLSAEERALVTLYQKTVIYGEMLRTLTPILPLETRLTPELAKQLNLPVDSPVTYLELKRAEGKVTARLKKIVASKGMQLDRYTPDEAALAQMATALTFIESGGAMNGVLRLVPPQWRENGNEWASPWQVLTQGKGSPQSADYLNDWAFMAQSFIAGDAAMFAATSARAVRTVWPQLDGPYAGARLDAEIWYDVLPVFTVCAWAFLATAILALVALKTNTVGRVAGRLAVWLFAFGLNLVLVGIVWRMFIMWRPPIATLYETMLFSAAVLVMAGAFIIRRAQGARLALLGITAFCTSLVLFISGFFQNDATDFEPLIAVLNTPFWLGTHVVMITAGYGACLMTAMLAHLCLLRHAYPAAQSRIPDLSAWLHVAALLSLFLVAVGTILGGVWADQSWGRFWGWDPKENGALLIVLWLVWLLHGKISGHVKTALWLGGLAGMTIIQALAWFGVNLLNTGLHSYGFIDSVADGLALFCLIQMAVILFLVWKGKTRHAA